MAKDSMTPEERLLKIIENPNTERRSLPLIMKAKSISVRSVQEWLGRLSLDKNALKKISFNLIVRIIAIACVIITLIWIFNFIKTGLNLNKRFKTVLSGEGLAGSDDDKRLNINVSADEAISQAEKRNIFTFLPTKEEAKAAVSVGPTLNNFKLVGILWSDNPQAMIENSAEQKTYFVSKGDRIGDLDVKNILRDKVMLGKGQDEWELR